MHQPKNYFAATHNNCAIDHKTQETLKTRELPVNVYNLRRRYRFSR